MHEASRVKFYSDFIHVIFRIDKLLFSRIIQWSPYLRAPRYDLQSHAINAHAMLFPSRRRGENVNDSE